MSPALRKLASLHPELANEGIQEAVLLGMSVPEHERDIVQELFSGDPAIARRSDSLHERIRLGDRTLLGAAESALGERRMVLGSVLPVARGETVFPRTADRLRARKYNPGRTVRNQMITICVIFCKASSSTVSAVLR